MITAEQLGGVLRAIVAAGSGYLVAKGVVDANTAAQIGGAIVTLVVAFWSLHSNRPSR